MSASTVMVRKKHYPYVETRSAREQVSSKHSKNESKKPENTASLSKCQVGGSKTWKYGVPRRMQYFVKHWRPSTTRDQRARAERKLSDAVNRVRELLHTEKDSNTKFQQQNNLRSSEKCFAAGKKLKIDFFSSYPLDFYIEIIQIDVFLMVFPAS